MTAKEELQSLIRRAAELPADARVELLQSLLEMDPQYQDIHHVDDDERAALTRSGGDMRRRRFASAEVINDVLPRPAGNRSAPTFAPVKATPAGRLRRP